MKKVIKVFVFTVAFLAIAAGAVFGYYKYQQSDFTYAAGTKSGTIEITGYLGSSVNLEIPKRIHGKKVAYIGQNAFYESDVTSVTLPDTVVSIKATAFKSCKKLKEVRFGGGLEEIGDFAFRGCTALTALEIDAPLKKIGDGAFLDCTALKTITVSEKSAFANENGLLLGKNRTQAEWVSADTDLSAFNYPETVKTFAPFFFYKHTELKSFVFPTGTAVVPKGIFAECTGLTSVTLPDSVTRIDENAFLNCTALQTLRIPKQVSMIGETVFTDMSLKALPVTLLVEEGSYAQTYAKKNELKYETAK